MGGAIARAEEVRHGKTSTIRHDGKGIHRGLPNPFTATRYHSLVANRHALPASLSVSALSEDDEQVMAVESRQGAVYGVQYHPESIATEVGKSIVHNFLDMEHVVNA
jgi:anthranilate synthase component 2